MWLPRPITQRSPMCSTGAGPRSWPGTMPADSVTSAPMRVSSPTTIQRSPNTEPGGKAADEPRPNAANRRRPGCPRSPSRRAWPPPRPSAPPASAAGGARLRSAPASVTGAHIAAGSARAGGSGHRADAASWPQAPSISRPRVSRTVTGTPCASRRRTNSRSRGGPRRGPLRAGRRVERDQVDVREPPGQQRAQQVGPPGLVVDVPDQRVLDRDPAAGGGGVGPGGVQHLGDLPAPVDRDQRVAQLVVRGVQGDGQGDGETFGGQAGDGRDQARRWRR